MVERAPDRVEAKKKQRSQESSSDAKIAPSSTKFLHADVTLRSGKQKSAQGSVFFINMGQQSEMILKSVSEFSVVCLT